MLASLDKDVSQMGTTDITEDVPDKPVNKTTSKTEVKHARQVLRFVPIGLGSYRRLGSLVDRSSRPLPNPSFWRLRRGGLDRTGFPCIRPQSFAGFSDGLWLDGIFFVLDRETKRTSVVIAVISSAKLDYLN